MSSCGEADRTVEGKRSAHEADGLAIVHCTPAVADSSSSAMTRRPRAVLAVQRPLSSGSRHCVNVLKELLPQEAIQEIHDQVSTGAKPLQAVEAVAQQRTRPQIAADVTKLFVSVSLASTAGSGVVTAAKGALCLLASPLCLRGPVRALTNVLLPTQAAGSLLGCCIVMHTARELLAADSSNEHMQQQQQQEQPAAAADGSSSSSSAGAAAAGKPKQPGRCWWVFGQRQKQARRQQIADSDAPTEQQQEAGKGEAGHAAAAAAAAAAEEPHAALMDLSPAGPVTPQPLPVAPHQSSSAAATADAAADAAAAAVTAAASSGTVVTSSGDPKPGPASHALSDPSLRDLQYLSSSSRSTGGGCMDPTAASSAAADPAPHSSSSSSSSSSSTGGSKQQGTGGPAPLPLSPTNSGLIGGDKAAPGQEEACNPSSPLADTPSPSAMQLRRRSSSGLGDCRSFTGSEPLSPTSSGPHTPKEASLEIEGQAAALHRGWSLGAHDDMIPHPQSFQMLQSQPYRPPVFTRLSSGRGGCRITAAAAAAAAREQHAAAQQARQRERAAAAAAAAGEGGLRRYHSLDLRRTEQGAAGAAMQGQQQGAAGAWAGTKAAGEAAAAAGCVEGDGPSASLPPLPAGGSKEGAAHEQQQQQQQQQQQGQEQVLQQVGRGFVRQRSLDWGHKLCKTDSM